MSDVNEPGRRLAVIIEDDGDIRQLLETVLVQAGFETVAVGNGADGVQAVRALDPLVTTLDVSMPGIDGFEAAKRIRSFSSTYLVMVTAQNEEIDALQGLDSGADDFVTKPFRPRELRARIEAMLRRPRGAGPAGAVENAATVPPLTGSWNVVQQPTPAPYQQQPASAAPYSPAALPVAYPPAAAPPVYPPAGQYAPPPLPIQNPAGSDPVAQVPPQPAAPVAPQPPHAAAAADEDTWLEHNGLRLNPQTRVAVLDGVEVELTRTEFDLICVLLESGRRVRSKSDLALAMRGESYVTTHFVSETDRRAVEVHMANLRRKLQDNIASPRFIETVRGVGYRLTAAVS